jgi:ATP-dependent DNA helicase RecQ
VQRQWQENAVVAVVATIAFGMGIDKSDLRWVMHYMPSSSLEGFAQVCHPASMLATEAGAAALPAPLVL